ncbi:glutathione synthetase-like isoform X1 [Ischnura elegans]|uniref:glutathione synthetase-like isoform X1 n=1 Tax=Ischnura elegans TaxID=197161 RepID=UPI001ED8780D|nr:glutathione synthetase-like isoform X1 [Ischnura elegans]
MEIPRLEPCIPLPLEDSVLEDLVDKAKDWAIMNGAGMRSKLKFSKNELHFAPFMLLPSTFPKREFEKAVAIQPILNELMHKVAHSYEFLSESLKSTIEVDDFTKRLFQIYETVRKEGFTQPISLGLIRSDLMLESDPETCIGKECCPKIAVKEQDKVLCNPYCCWKQVEVNTIASGFGWLGPASRVIQRYVLQELGHADLLPHLPENNALQGLCGGMIEAWKLYGKPESVILFVVEDITYNICDQRFHEFEIRKMEPKVRVIRRTLTDLGKRSTLTEEKILMIDGLEVAVVYYRSGYAPTQYHSELEWEARLKVERSLSIKCPSIQYHLAGTKRVQQALASPAVLERFLDSSVAASVREIFTGLYTLDLSDEGNAAVEMALKNPTHYVLKPQREGGGNNVYGEEVKLMLEKMGNSNERSAWILMERIIPPVQRCYLIHPNSDTPVYTDVVSELGIFGVIIGDEKVILKNSQVGHMLRTKVATANEGGVAAGYGALDSPFLVEMKSCCHPIIQN